VHGRRGLFALPYDEPDPLMVPFDGATRDDGSDRLIDFIRGLADFQIVHAAGRYNHIGATLADAILQAGLSYDSVVRPRVMRVKNAYPEATNLTVFRDICLREGAEKILDMKGAKPARLMQLISLLIDQGIDSEDALRNWIMTPDNADSLMTIGGIKQKTRDYLLILLGHDTAAVDVQVRWFVRQAGIETQDYDKIKLAVEAAADKMRVPRADLDYSIWLYARSAKV